jgi:hypothetical protein
MIVGDISPASCEETNILQPVQGLTLITLSQPLTVFPNSARILGRRGGLCKLRGRKNGRTDASPKPPSTI